MEAESIAIFDILDRAYPEEIRFIKERNPFRFLCTVILSASSTDRQAEKAEHNLNSALPTPSDILSADISLIESLINGAGLSKSKARSIKALSEVYLREGKIPESIEELTRIPGIGVKTANCYLVDILSKPGVIVDTHFARVSHRLGLTSSENRSKVYKEIRESFPCEYWARLSMTLNLHGRLYCKARKPLCRDCMLSSICPSRASFS